MQEQEFYERSVINLPVLPKYERIINAIKEKPKSQEEINKVLGIKSGDYMPHFRRLEKIGIIKQVRNLSLKTWFWQILDINKFNRIKEQYLKFERILEKRKSIESIIIQTITIDISKKKKAIQLCLKYGPLKRQELVDILDIARTTIYDILEKLEMQGITIRIYYKPSSYNKGTKICYWMLKEDWER